MARGTDGVPPVHRLGRGGVPFAIRERATSRGLSRHGRDRHQVDGSESSDRKSKCISARSASSAAAITSARREACVHLVGLRARRPGPAQFPVQRREPGRTVDASRDVAGEGMFHVKRKADTDDDAVGDLRAAWRHGGGLDALRWGATLDWMAVDSSPTVGNA